MFLFYYISLNLVVVLFALLLCSVAETQRRTHAHRLDMACRKYAAVFGKCTSSGDYRLPDPAVRRLKHNIGMEAFFKELNKLEADTRRSMMLTNSDKMIKLMKKEKNATVHAYFAYMLKGIHIVAPGGGGYGMLMLKFLEDRSVFARENALKSIYSFGDERLVEEAFMAMSERGDVHNEKLLLDGLLSFPGDREKLATLLMKHYDNILECYRNSLINFLNLAGIDKYDDMLIKRAERAETSVDTVCCITRKMNKVQSDRNLRYLKGITNRFTEGGIWEPVSIAVMGLGSYPEDPEVKGILKKELLSRNWYIRNHSAESLASIGVTEEDLEEISATNDKFANDAIRYAIMRLDHV